jgi:hypothetical protein
MEAVALRTTLAPFAGRTFVGCYIDPIKRNEVKALRPLAKAGLITIVKCAPIGYCGTRPIRVYFTAEGVQALTEARCFQPGYLKVAPVPEDAEKLA